MQNHIFRIESCAEQQISIDDLSEERQSAQIPIKQHCNFRWRCAKAWKRCLAWFWIHCKQIGRNWMFESHIETCIAWTSFDFRFEDIFNNLLLNIVIYSTTDHSSITWSWSRRSVLIIKFSALTFLWLITWSCSWRIEQKLCKEKTFTIICIEKRFVVNNFDMSCLALKCNSSNPRLAILQLKHRFKVTKYDESYTVLIATLIQTHGLMVKSQWVERHGFVSRRVLKFSVSLRPFCVALSPSVHWHARF